ncbi:PREDICTED: uncharacterized protein LOC109470610 [Branchiostoma belcheri]|uniref:Uncharacterized protein LOC109470610 n=1 Tax=Branchiostoma belcheri TaxID=7741 RepID=A0A6P4Z6E4_BRABE|nr:PREDICTED: uncharacterized protein LOC109470610 [Branchiostoma belcheri]
MMVTIGLLALLLASGFPGLAAGEDCSGDSQYLDIDGNCRSCNEKTCPAGQKAKQDCGSGKDLICEPCTDLPSGKTCAKGVERDCISCKRQHKKTARECNAHLDSVCFGCLDGYFPKARIQGEVDCIRCDAEKNNRSECMVPENPVIKCAPPDPKQYKAKLEDDQHYKESQRWTVIAAVALTAAAALTVIVAISLKRKLCKPHGPYHRAPGRDPEAPYTPERRHPAVADRVEKSSTLTEESEDDQCRVDTNNKKVKFTKARASSNQSEDGQKLLQSNNVPDSKRPKLKLKMPKRSSVGELEVRVSGSRTSSPVKAVPTPKKGTPSPFPVSDREENVFSYPAGNQPVNVQPELHVIEDAQEPFVEPTTSQTSTPTGSLDLSGQTARLHKDSRPNHTANDYASNLAWCKERASSILLDNDWFSYNIQQTLAVYLDRLPPLSSMPTWRTFFERGFGLTKLDLDGVNTQSVPSPTLALFAVLQTRTAKDRHTVKKVLETLHDLMLYDAANYLCEELLEYKQKPKS